MKSMPTPTPLTTDSQFQAGPQKRERRVEGCEKERGVVGAGGVQGWAPAAVGTCVAIVFGTGMTGEPALMLVMLGCVLGVIEAMPAV